MTTKPPESRRQRPRASTGQPALARRCRTCPARDTSLCSALKDREFAGLHATRSRLLVPPGRQIDHCDDACGNVVSGALKLSVHARDGREQIVGLLFVGDFFGEPFRYNQAVTVTALAETELCAFSRDAFARTLHVRPRLRRLLLERTIASLAEAREWLRLLGHASACERVAAFILDLAARADGVTVRIPMRRKDVANFLGLTAETVSRELARLRAEGAIRFLNARDCTVLDHAKLAAIARR